MTVTTTGQEGKILSRFLSLSSLSLLSVVVKVLLIPSYHSTDFDVHRNWLAITRHLPISRWYFDDVNGTTGHTLDYPPGFAFFELLQSRNYITNHYLANNNTTNNNTNGWPMIDDDCLALLGDDDNTPTDQCVVFQRLLVILFDFVYVFGSYFASSSFFRSSRRRRGGDEETVERQIKITTALLVLNPGMIMLDHVHFQYNGLLLGILLCSIGCLARGSRDDETGISSSPPSFLQKHKRYDILGAILYAALITMKHLYLALGPLYFVYLLRHYCFVKRKTVTYQKSNSAQSDETLKSSSTATVFSVSRFLFLALVTGTTLLLPFLPFLLLTTNPMEQMQQILHRLFPFQRGLCHDYWAANVWALYLFCDKILTSVCHKFQIVNSIVPPPLPDVSPTTAACLLAIGLTPAMVCAWRNANPKADDAMDDEEEETVPSYADNSSELQTDNNASLEFETTTTKTRAVFFVQGMVFTAFSSFMLSYHVHEKAIMTAIVPLTLVSTLSVQHARLYLRTCALGHFALFPLLFRPVELLFKSVAYVSFSGFSVFLLRHHFTSSDDARATTNSGKVNQISPVGKSAKLITRIDEAGLLVLGLIFIYMEIIHPLLLRPDDYMEFLPLMTTSVFCAVGLILCWMQSARLMIGSVSLGNTE